MSVNPPLMVTKADGSRELFSEEKLRRCLSLALESGGFETMHAGALAAAVRMHLQREADTTELTSEYLLACATAVLQQTGAGEAADELQRRQRERDGLRRRTRVFNPERPSKGLKVWRKSALVECLLKKHGLDAKVARMLAGEVEMRVFASGYQVVRSPLISEMIRNELMAWGLIDDLAVGRHAELWSEPVGSKWPVREE
ncbi:MAG: hypothetical protein JNG88_09755 [Phycisphaerales bacterium]|nr:hypothetical protein [Phycisphaerales bacterium]